MVPGSLEAGRIAVCALTRCGCAAQGSMPTPAQARAQMTVPETPSSAMAATAQVLQQRLKQVSLAAGAAGGPGRFEDNTPSRRATKSRRMALQGAGGGSSAWLRTPHAVAPLRSRLPVANGHGLMYMSFQI